MTSESATEQSGYVVVSPANLAWPWVSIDMAHLDGTTPEDLQELLYDECHLQSQPVKLEKARKVFLSCETFIFEQADSLIEVHVLDVEIRAFESTIVGDPCVQPCTSTELNFNRKTCTIMEGVKITAAIDDPQRLNQVRAVVEVFRKRWPEVVGRAEINWSRADERNPEWQQFMAWARSLRGSGIGDGETTLAQDALGPGSERWRHAGMGADGAYEVLLSITPQQTGVIAECLNGPPHGLVFNVERIGKGIRNPADANPVHIMVSPEAGLDCIGVAAWITVIAIPGGALAKLKPSDKCLAVVLPLWNALTAELDRLGAIRKDRKGDASQKETDGDKESAIAERRRKVVQLWSQREKGESKEAFKRRVAVSLAVSESTIRDDLRYLENQGKIE